MRLYIGLPDLSMRWKYILLSVLIALVVVSSVIKGFKETTILVILILAFLVFLLITADSGSNLAGSLPSVTYPTPPHLGLDGVDRENI